MKKIFFFFFSLLFTQHFINAQKTDKELVDSLLTVLPKLKEDTLKVNLYADLMYAHVYYKPEDGLKYQKTALELAQKLNWKPGIAIIKEKTGRLQWRMGNFEDALKNHFEALSLYQETGRKLNEGYVLVEIGQDYLDGGKYPEAKIYLQKAAKFSKETGSIKLMKFAYNILSYLYESQNDIAGATGARYEYLKIAEKSGDKNAVYYATTELAFNAQNLGNRAEALKYLNQGIQVSKETGDKMNQAYCYGAIGKLYMEEGNFPEANSNYSIAIGLATEINDVQLLADMYYETGDLRQAEDNHSEALKNYLIAEAKYKSITNKQGLASTYSKMGLSYTRLKKYAEAKKSLDAATVLNRQLDNNISMTDYYKGMEMLDSATGNWQSAYLQYKKYVAVKDSSFNKETLKKMVSSQIHYENEKKEAIVKAEQEKKDLIAQGEIKRQRNILYSSFAVLAVVLLFSVMAYRQRNKLAREKKRSDQLLADKELLLREIHHRVKNNLEVVSSLLALQSAQIDDPNTRDAMLEGQNRVQSIGIVHQKLYQGENLGAIEMKDYFLNLSESILDSFGADKRVQIECAMDKLNIDIDTAVPLGLIVNELLTNTLKYAFPDGRDGKVRIKLEKRTDGILQLQVSDNGIGKSGITKGTGFGSQLISLLTQQLSGTMKEEVNNGTHTIFEFKTGKAA